MNQIKSIPIGQYIEQDSILHQLDPRTKMVIVFLFMITVFLIHHPISYVLAFIFVITNIILSKISFVYIVKSLKGVWILFSFTFIFHILLTKGGDLIVEWWVFSIYEGGIYKGVEVISRLTLLLLLTALLTLTTKPLDITEGMEKLFSPLKLLRVPVHELALMVSISLRFIPTLMEELDKILKAQRARGVQFSKGTLYQRGIAVASVLIPMFISSFQRAEELALAMEARGYKGGVGRTRLKQLRFSNLDLVSLLLVILYFTCMLLIKGE